MSGRAMSDMVILRESQHSPPFRPARRMISEGRRTFCLVFEEVRVYHPRTFWTPCTNCRVPFLVASLVLLIVIAGCGGGSGTNFNNVTVTVSPVTATVPVEIGRAHV